MKKKLPGNFQSRSSDDDLVSNTCETKLLITARFSTSTMTMLIKPMMGQEILMTVANI